MCFKDDWTRAPANINALPEPFAPISTISKPYAILPGM